MKISLQLTIALLLTTLLVNCSGDYRQRAVGGFSEVTVIMDSTEWDSETAQAIRDVYGGPITTLPNYEPAFDLRFRDFRNNEELERLRKHKNIIIAAPVDDSSNVGRFVRALLSDEVEERVREGNSFAFPLEDEWYRDQWSIILTSSSDTALARRIRDTDEMLVESLMEKELQRWTYEIYDDGEQLAMEDSLWQNHGWMIRVQHDWRKNIDTTYVEEGRSHHFLTMRRPLPQNDRWFWAWWTDSVSTADFIDKEWINSKRDSLMEKWIRGTREDSYVTTEYRRSVIMDTLTVDGRRAYEMLGTWRMTNDAMGGPFASLVVYDEVTKRLFLLEFGQFAPKYDKRRFVRQFRAMLRTFESDSSWTPPTTEEQTLARR